MALIWPSLRRKFGILVVGRKSLGFFSHTGIQSRFNFKRTSLRLGPTFLMSWRRLLLVRSSWTTRRSSLLLATLRATARSLRRLAVSFEPPKLACFIKIFASLLFTSFFSSPDF